VPATVGIADASATTSVTSLDAITFVDQHTGRTFVSQLAAAISLFSYSDDAGKTYTPSQGSGAGAVLDHQTVGGGPFHAGTLPSSLGTCTPTPSTTARRTPSTGAAPSARTAG